MQHEKLYNLQRTAYSLVIPFVFKIDKILCSSVSTLRKKSFFSNSPELVLQNFVHFENKKCNYIISCSL